MSRCDLEDRLRRRSQPREVKLGEGPGATGSDGGATGFGWGRDEALQVPEPHLWTTVPMLAHEIGCTTHEPPLETRIAEIVSDSDLTVRSKGDRRLEGHRCRVADL